MKRLKIILQSKLLVIILFVFILLYILLFTCFIKYKSSFSDGINSIYGKVTNLKVSDDKISFVLVSKNEKVLVNYYNSINIYEGIYIKCVGKLSDAKNNTIPNTFNYKKYLYNNKIYKVMTASSIDFINDCNVFYKVKYKIVSRINSFDNTYKYLKLFILGSKESLDNDVYDAFKDNGIAHLLAISGMHISLFILILKKILFKLSDTKQFLLIIVFLSFYLFITSFTVSVLRVFIFYILNFINKRIKLGISGVKLLFFTAFILLLINPFNLYSVAFRYSIVITFGILLSKKFLKGNYFKQLFLISIISLLFSLPITVSLNYEVNIISLLANIIMVPYVSLFLYPFTLLVFIFKFLNPVYLFAINTFEFLNNIFYKLQIMINIPKMNIVIISLYYLFLILFIIFNKKKYLCFIIIVLFFNKYIYKIDPGIYINYFDVGQGDAIALIEPKVSKAYMIDTGGLHTNYHVSDSILLYFKSIGITSLECLIITHGDYDHMGEAINLVNNFKIEKVIFNCGPYNDLEKELIKVLDKKKIKYNSCIKELNIDNNKLYFLQTKEYDNENDNSNVIYTELNGYKFMFMGDASTTTEKEILNEYNLTEIDVLKVGHHGSKTSSGKEFIDEVNPKYSIISVGKNNRYGHPNKEVLYNLEKAKIYRTDQDGSIMFKVNNNKLKIDTCSP